MFLVPVVTPVVPGPVVPRPVVVGMAVVVRVLVVDSNGSAIHFSTILRQGSLCSFIVLELHIAKSSALFISHSNPNSYN